MSLSGTKTKIIIIATYFGKWPVWFPAFLLSCATNKNIKWLLFTNCEIPRETYPNISFEPMDLGQFNDLASRKLGFQIQKSIYSHVDLQPAYGVIFEEYIKGYDFWGHCDIDIIWGDIRNFITEAILQNYDILSSRKDFLAGHFTLWRNEPDINSLFKEIPAYRRIFSSSDHHGFDEPIMSTFLKTLIATGSSNIRIYWKEQLVGSPYAPKAKPDGWYWADGKVFDTRHREYIYLHFQEGKKSVTSIDFQVGDHPESFKLTKSGIRSRPTSIRDLLSDKFKRDKLTGSISKITCRSMQLIRQLKMVLFVKNNYWGQRLMANSISAIDVQYVRKTGGLFLKCLDLHLSKKHQFLLGAYYWALQLVNQRSARFFSDEHDQLFVDVAGLRVSIQTAEDIFTLKELLLDGIYNVQFSNPTVVLDIGMNVGLTCLYFASQPNVVVVGYEPCFHTYNQALHNIALNPQFSDKIQTFKADIGDAKFKSIAMYYPKIASQPHIFVCHSDSEHAPDFVYEEIEVEDAVEIIESIVAEYPGFDVVLKIDYDRTEYFVDGVSEYPLINELYAASKLSSIEAIMSKWHKPLPEYDPSVIVRQLSEFGFKVFLFSRNAYQGSLYAVRKALQKADSN